MCRASPERSAVGRRGAARAGRRDHAPAPSWSPPDARHNPAVVRHPAADRGIRARPWRPGNAGLDRPRRTSGSAARLRPSHTTVAGRSSERAQRVPAAGDVGEASATGGSRRGTTLAPERRGPGATAGAGKGPASSVPGRPERGGPCASQLGRSPGPDRRLLATRALAAVVGACSPAASFPPYDLAGCAPPALAVTAGWHGARGRAVCSSGCSPGSRSSAAAVAGCTWWATTPGGPRDLLRAVVVALLGGARAVTSGCAGGRWWAAAVGGARRLAADRSPFGGFPWGRLAFGQTATPLTPYAALGGAPAVTFAVALVGSLLAWRARCRCARPRPRLSAATLRGRGRRARAAAWCRLPPWRDRPAARRP